MATFPRAQARLHSASSQRLSSAAPGHAPPLTDETRAAVNRLLEFEKSLAVEVGKLPFRSEQQRALDRADAARWATLSTTGGSLSSPQKERSAELESGAAAQVRRSMAARRAAATTTLAKARWGGARVALKKKERRLEDGERLALAAGDRRPSALKQAQQRQRAERRRPSLLLLAKFKAACTDESTGQPVRTLLLMVVVVVVVEVLLLVVLVVVLVVVVVLLLLLMLLMLVILSLQFSIYTSASESSLFDKGVQERFRPQSAAPMYASAAAAHKADQEEGFVTRALETSDDFNRSRRSRPSSAASVRGEVSERIRRESVSSAASR